MYIYMIVSIHRTTGESTGRSTLRQISFSRNLFVNDYLTNKRRKNIQASYVRKKVTAPFHALPWTRRARSRRHVRASLMSRYTHSRESAPMQLAAMCIGIMEKKERRHARKKFFGASRPLDAFIRSCVSWTYQIQYNSERYNIQVIPPDSLHLRFLAYEYTITPVFILISVYFQIRIYIFFLEMSVRRIIIWRLCIFI